MTLETISAGTAVLDRSNLAGQVPGGEIRPTAAPGPSGWGLGERPTTPPCKTFCIMETASTLRPYARQRAKKIGEVR